MVLWLCAHLPALPLDALRPGALDALPMLVWQGQGDDQRQQRTVQVVNAAARALGLRPGLRLSTAQALAPQALIRARDAQREATFLADLALALGTLSPQLSVQAPDVLMEIGSCLRLFGGVRRLQRRAQHIARDCGARVHWGLASTPLAARLLARQRHPADESRPGAPRCLRPASTRRALAAVPLSTLAQVTALAPDGLAMFAGLGVHTLGALQALPRAGLARRGGRAWLDALDRATGASPDPQPLFEPPEHFERPLELAQRSDNAETLAAAVAQLLLPLAGWLGLRWQAAQRLSLTLQHERRLHAPPPPPGVDDPSIDRLQLDLAVPSRDATQLALLWRERLQRHPLRAPVYALRLSLVLSVAHAGHPGSLIPDARQRQRELGLLLERLRTRLGTERVCRLHPVDDARPECAGAATPLQAGPGDPAPSRRRPTGGPTRIPAATSAPARPGLDTPPRPAWLLPEPLPLDEHDGHPLLPRGGPAALSAPDARDTRPVDRRLLLLGPAERIEAGWFDERLVQRDYHVALGRDGVLRWIYRERPARTDGPDPGAPRWFLHGLFA